MSVRYVTGRSYLPPGQHPYQVIAEWNEGAALVSRHLCLCADKETAEKIAAALNGEAK